MDGFTRVPVPLGRSVRRLRCRGTVEDCRHRALDVRELIRRGVFDHSVGTMWRGGFEWPWIATLKLDQWRLELTLRTGRTETVPLAWARCGAIGHRLRLRCPRCDRIVCKVYQLDDRTFCRACGRLWYAAQRVSATARKVLARQKIRRKLGAPDHYRDARGDWHTATGAPPKPPRMWRRTYARHLAKLARLGATGNAPPPLKESPRRHAQRRAREERAEHRVAALQGRALPDVEREFREHHERRPRRLPPLYEC